MDEENARAPLPAEALRAHEGGRCTRCGGAHTGRQPCPLDAPAATDAPFAAEAPVVAVDPVRPVPPAIDAPRMIAPPPRVPVPLPAIEVYARRPRGVVRTLGSWLGGVVGTLTLLVCLIVIGGFIAGLTDSDTDVARALIGIAIALAVGVTLGMGLLYVAARTYAMVAFALVALTLLTGGPLMIVAAFVVRQVNTPELAEYRGAAALWWFGALTTLLGVALTAWLAMRTQRRSARREIARWARLIGAGYGVLIGLSGVVTVFTLLALLNAEAVTDVNGAQFSVVEQSLSTTIIAMWLLVPGMLLTYHTISSSMGEGSGPFRTPPAVAPLWLFGGVMLLGHGIMTQDSPVAAPMPPLHVLAASMPGLTLAAMATRGSLLRGRHTAGLTWRQVMLAIAVSMGVATMIAVYVEVVGSLYGVILLLVHNGAFASAETVDDFWTIVGEADFILTENEQFAAGLITAALIAPVIEEFAKSLAVRFTMSTWTTRSQAFVLGAYAGAAFGFLEALSYGVAGVGDDLGGWWQIMLLRGGSTSLHVLCTGLAGLGWWYWSRAGRARPAAALFATAIAIHAGWNGVFTAIESRIFVLDTLSNDALETVAYVIVVIVSVTMIVTIPLVARRLRDAAPPAIADTPLGGMAPWLG